MDLIKVMCTGCVGKPETTRIVLYLGSNREAPLSPVHPKKYKRGYRKKEREGGKRETECARELYR